MSTRRSIIMFFIITLCVGIFFIYVGLRPFIFTEIRNEILPITSIYRLLIGLGTITSLLSGFAAMFLVCVIIKFEFFEKNKLAT